MNIKTSFVLILLFLALGTLAIFDPFHWKDKREKAAEREKHVVWVDESDRLEWVAVTARNLRVWMKCKREKGCGFDNQGEWEIASPVQDEGDAADIGALLSSLRNLNQVDRMEFPEGVKEAEYGFDKPSAVLEYKLKGKEGITYLRFGRKSAVGADTYVLTNAADKTVFLVADYFPRMLSQDLFHWRNKKILPGWDSDKVGFLAWEEGKKSFAFRKSGGGWKMEKPQAVPGGGIMLEGLVSTLVYASAKAHYDGKTGRKLLSIRMEGEGGKSAALDFFEKPGARDWVARVKGADTLYAVDPTPFERFRKDADEYRERKLLPLQSRSLFMRAELRFPREKKRLVVTEENGSWKYTEGDKPAEELSEARLKAFFDALAGDDAVEFKKLAAPTMPPDLEAELFDAGGKRVGLFRLYAFSRDKVLAPGDLPGEYRVMGEAFAKAMPVRYANLYKSAERQVVVPGNEEHGHDGQHHQD